MTQPINEPSTARSIGYGRWRTNQLERRPPPTSGLPQVFRAEQWDEETTTGTSVDMELIEFDLWGNPDATIFNEVETGGLLGSVQLLVPGFIVLTAITQWPVGFDFSVATLIEDGEHVWPGMGTEYTRKMRAGHGDGMDYVTTLTRYYPTLDWEEGHGGDRLPEFAFWAGQASGATRTCQTRVDIAYFAATIGAIAP